MGTKPKMIRLSPAERELPPNMDPDITVTAKTTVLAIRRTKKPDRPPIAAMNNLLRRLILCMILQFSSDCCHTYMT
jgi:hypothetical protein